MSESPSKRRKTSPTTSIATGAPSLQNHNAPAPSFASPTRASAAKRDANLERRGFSPAKGISPLSGPGKNVQNLFAKALGEAQPTTGDEHAGTMSGTAAGAGLAAKPRRMSKSPSKPLWTVDRTSAPPMELEGISNPFQKRGLRRSPVGSPAAAVFTIARPTEETNPFQRKGLRRSPQGSQPSQASQTVQTILRDEALRQSSPIPETTVPARSPEPFSTTPEGMPPAKALHAVHAGPTGREHRIVTTIEPAKRALRKSSVRSQSSPEPRQPLSKAEQPIQRSPDAVVPNDDKALLAVADVTVNHKEQRQTSPETRSSPPIAISKPSRSTTWGKDVSAASQNTASRLSRPPIARQQLQSARPEEPELPPTPTQRGLADPIVTTPPSGIHNTPGKRDRARLKKALKSSPLKPRDERPQDETAMKATSLSSISKTKEAGPTPRPALMPRNANVKEKPQRRKSARFSIPVDPHAAQKKERDALVEQLKQLQADVALANQETERLRLLQQTTSKNSSQKIPARNSEELVSMLTRSIAEKAPPSPISSQPTTIFNSINAFLPFRPRRKVNAVLTPRAQEALEKPLPSMLPLHQSDPLPFLQAFSPLRYTQTISLLPSAPAKDPSSSVQLQEHVISAYHPSQLFLSKISLVVNTTNQTIHNLEILRLDAAAEQELGDFLRQKAEAKELSVVGWAIGRWAECAIARARFWCAIHSEFSSMDSLQAAVQHYKNINNKRKRVNSAAAEAEDDTNNKARRWTRVDLLLHMQRTSYEISSEELVLRIEWRLVFDWTGEAENCISAMIKLPPNCKYSFFVDLTTIGADKRL